ncbi:MAG TPA: HD domain-containing protein, partial [Armatimonadota bacterium]|nr:HD domain-containing protein [Armatimonadota bacterium]
MALAVEPEVLSIEPVIERVRAYDPGGDAELLRRAFTRAEQAHAGQLRDSGVPYIAHPLQVAHILADLSSDVPTIAAGLLHDVVEDTIIDLETIRAEFGDEVARLVDG